jgi:hypothetical protein
MDTAPTANTKVMVHPHLFPGAIITVLYRTSGNTGMTIDAFFLIHPNNRTQLTPTHSSPRIRQFPRRVHTKDGRFYENLAIFILYTPLEPKKQ